MKTCTNCIHYIHDIKNPAAPEVWYNHFCGASERKKAKDPVTGKDGWGGQNDFGTQYVSDQQYDYCRDVNKGSCTQFATI